MKKTYIHCNNQEEWSFILNKYGKLGYYWVGGDSKATRLDEFRDLFTYKERNGISHDMDIIILHSYSDDDKACSLNSISYAQGYGVNIINAHSIMNESNEVKGLDELRNWLYSDI